MSARGIFVTGTDTSVGKTLVACALLHACAAHGLRAVGMKPVASGADLVDGELRNGDVEQLLAASSVRVPRALMNVYCFAAPVSPHIAAHAAGVAIEIASVERAYHALAQRADVVVVEGVGGFRVPLDEARDTSDLAAALRLPVVMVVGMRLGCLNHALLTAAAIQARGLRLAGWIANHVDRDMREADANVATLAQRLAAPRIVRIGHDPALRAADVARELDPAFFALR
jgi:dethiobiotin synthetase